MTDIYQGYHSTVNPQNITPDLTKDDFIQHIKELRSWINTYDYAYYRLNESIISDFDYDELKRELLYYETHYAQDIIDHFGSLIASVRVDGGDLDDPVVLESIHKELLPNFKDNNSVIDAVEVEEVEASELKEESGDLKVHPFAELLLEKSAYSPQQVVKTYKEVSDVEIDVIAEEWRSKEVSHEKAMLSLANVYNEAEFKDWLETLQDSLKKANIKDIELCCEPKLDGIAVSIIYQNGKFLRAVTRGTGSKGYDISRHISRIPNIPQHLPELVEKYKAGQPSTLEVRGEVVMTQENFDRINELYEQHGKKPLANLRNASGSFLSREPYRRIVKKYRKEVAGERIPCQDLLIIDNLPSTMPLKVFIYSVNQAIVADENLLVGKHADSLKWAKSLGFEVNSLVEVNVKTNNLLKFYNNLQALRPTLGYDIDGTVFKVNDYALQEVIGWIANSPKWAKAWKFPPMEAETTLLDVITSTGSAGAVTPVAKVAPCLVGGAEISNLSLYNTFNIDRLDLHYNDKVIIYRGGDVIPVLKQALPEKRSLQNRKVVVPPTCPSSGEFLIEEETSRLTSRRVVEDGAQISKIFNISNYGLLAEQLNLYSPLELEFNRSYKNKTVLDVANKAKELIEASPDLNQDSSNLRKLVFEDKVESIPLDIQQAVQDFNETFIKDQLQSDGTFVEATSVGVNKVKAPTELCRGTLLGSVGYFFSKDGIDIKGLGTAIIDNFISLGLVSSWLDMFNLADPDFLDKANNKLKNLFIKQGAYELAYKKQEAQIGEIIEAFDNLVSDQESVESESADKATYKGYQKYRQQLLDFITKGEALRHSFTWDYLEEAGKLVRELTSGKYYQAVTKFKGVSTNKASSLGEDLLVSADYRKTLNEFKDRYNSNVNRLNLLAIFVQKLGSQLAELLKDSLSTDEGSIKGVKEKLLQNLTSNKNNQNQELISWLDDYLDGFFVDLASTSLVTKTHQVKIESDATISLPAYRGGHLPKEIFVVPDEEVKLAPYQDQEEGTYALTQEEGLSPSLKKLEDLALDLIENIHFSPLSREDLALVLDLVAVFSITGNDRLARSFAKALPALQVVDLNFYPYKNLTQLRGAFTSNKVITNLNYQDYLDSLEQEEIDNQKLAIEYPDKLRKEFDFSLVSPLANNFTVLKNKLKEYLNLSDSGEKINSLPSENILSEYLNLGHSLDDIDTLLALEAELRQVLANGDELSLEENLDIVEDNKQIKDKASLVAEIVKLYESYCETIHKEEYNSQEASLDDLSIANSENLLERKYNFRIFDFLLNYVYLSSPVLKMEDKEFSLLSVISGKKTKVSNKNKGLLSAVSFYNHVTSNSKVDLSLGQLTDIYSQYISRVSFNNLWDLYFEHHQNHKVFSYILVRELVELKAYYNVGEFKFQDIFDRYSDDDLKYLLESHEKKKDIKDWVAEENNFFKMSLVVRTEIFKSFIRFLSVLKENPLAATPFIERYRLYLKLVQADRYSRLREFRTFLDKNASKVKAKVLPKNKKALVNLDIEQALGSTVDKESLVANNIYVESIVTAQNIIDSTQASFGIYILGDKFFESNTFSGKVYEKLSTALKELKEIPLATFISSLGIPGIGQVLAETLSGPKLFPTIEDYLNFDQHKIEDIINSKFSKKENKDYKNLDIGAITGWSIINYFNNPKHRQQIQGLLDLGVKIKSAEAVYNNIFTGKKVAITGSLEGLSRKDFASFIKDSGGTFSSSVTKDTDYLVTNSEFSEDGAGLSTKAKKALEQGIEVVSGSKFQEVYQQSINAK